MLETESNNNIIRLQFGKVDVTLNKHYKDLIHLIGSRGYIPEQQLYSVETIPHHMVKRYLSKLISLELLKVEKVSGETCYRLTTIGDTIESVMSKLEGLELKVFLE